MQCMTNMSEITLTFETAFFLGIFCLPEDLFWQIGKLNW